MNHIGNEKKGTNREKDYCILSNCHFKPSRAFKRFQLFSILTISYHSYFVTKTRIKFETLSVTRRDGDRKRAPFLVLGLPHDMGQFFYFNCAIACGTRAYMLRGFFADVGREKWRPKFPKSFMLLAHTSTPLWLLEFCLSIFAVSCSSLSGDSAKVRYVPIFHNVTHFSQCDPFFQM